MPEYRVITLTDRAPPDEVLRHALMEPGETGRYGKVIRYRHEATKTVYEVLLFKAGRPPNREEVLADLRADVAAIDRRLAEGKEAGAVAGWIDRNLFQGAKPGDLERRRADILETIAAVEENYAPGEAVPVP